MWSALYLPCILKSGHRYTQNKYEGSPREGSRGGQGGSRGSQGGVKGGSRGSQGGVKGESRGSQGGVKGESRGSQGGVKGESRGSQEAEMEECNIGDTQTRKLATTAGSHFKGELE